MATLYKRGDAYYLNWREGGNQYRRSLGKVDRRQAEALCAEKEAELAGLIAPRSGLTVRMILAEYLSWSEKARPDSHGGSKAALGHLLPIVGDHPAESFDIGHVERWAGTTTRAPASVAKTIKMARAAYRYGIKRRLIRENPFDRVSLPKIVTSRAPPYFTRPQLDALYKTARGPVWRFMANTGLRRAEMAKARRSDVRDGLLYVESTPTGRTKSGKWRSIPLNAQAKAALKKLGEDRLVDCHTDTLSDWFAKDAEGIGGTLHWLRHTFCTYLAKAGVSLHDIKDLAGHSSVAVTEMYAHHMPGAGKAAVAKLRL